MTAGPQLRDIHLPAEPGWWPPTLVALLLLAIALVVLVAALAWLGQRVRRWREVRRLARFFDDEVAVARNDGERLQRASSCLRRAVARTRSEAVALTGEAWLAVLDGDDRSHPFTRGPGRLLAEGPFRGDVAPGEADAAVLLARARFIRLGAGHDA
nr:DUF4381 domain-containing protein [Alkalisalibacterium limincola]